MTSDGQGYPSRIRLFRSDRLERLTTISHRGFALLWLCMLSLVLWAGWGTVGAEAGVGLVLLGVVVWTLFEYALHRYVFHWRPRWTVARAVIFVVHTNHHEDPVDPGRSLMPPVISLPITATMWALFLLAMGPPGSLLLLGFLAGYVAYDGTHHACHHFPMRGPLFRALRRHHLRHHHARQEGNFAITAIFWDRLFGSRILIKGR